VGTKLLAGVGTFVAATALAVAAAVPAVAQIAVPPVQLPLAPAAAGVRLTVYSASATIRGTAQQAQFKPGCDPAVEDCWIDPATGQTIGQTEVPSAAGDGFTEVSILQLDAQTCVARIVNYSPELNTGAMLSAGRQSAVLTGGSCSDFWVPPAQLAAMAVGTVGEVRVLRGPYVVGGVTFDAVSVTTSSAQAWTSSTYDAATGYLLIASTRSQGAAVPTISNDVITQGAGSTQLTYSRVVGARQLGWLAAAEPLPAQALGVSRLAYGCVMTTRMSGVDVATQLPCGLEATVTSRNERYVELATVLSQSDGITSVPTTTQGTEVVVAGGSGGLFASPTWLAGLQPGTVLDADPVTGVQTVVASNDGRSVVIREQTAVEVAELTYDVATGWLQRSAVVQQLGQMTFTTEYTLTSIT